MGLTEALERRRVIRWREGTYAVPAGGAAVLTELGLDLRAVRERRRSFARPCRDWTEGRFHLAGALGAALAARLLELGWVERLPGTRAVRVPPGGRHELERRFGLELPPAAG